MGHRSRPRKHVWDTDIGRAADGPVRVSPCIMEREFELGIVDAEQPQQQERGNADLCQSTEAPGGVTEDPDARFQPGNTIPREEAPITQPTSDAELDRMRRELESDAVLYSAMDGLMPEDNRAAQPQPGQPSPSGRVAEVYIGRDRLGRRIEYDRPEIYRQNHDRLNAARRSISVEEGQAYAAQKRLERETDPQKRKRSESQLKQAKARVAELQETIDRLTPEYSTPYRSRVIYDRSMEVPPTKSAEKPASNRDDIRQWSGYLRAHGITIRRSESASTNSVYYDLIDDRSGERLWQIRYSDHPKPGSRGGFFADLGQTHLNSQSKARRAQLVEKSIEAAKEKAQSAASSTSSGASNEKGVAVIDREQANTTAPEVNPESQPSGREAEVKIQSVDPAELSFKEKDQERGKVERLKEAYGDDPSSIDWSEQPKPIASGQQSYQGARARDISDYLENPNSPSGREAEDIRNAARYEELSREIKEIERWISEHGGYANATWTPEHQRLNDRRGDLQIEQARLEESWWAVQIPGYRDLRATIPDALQRIGKDIRSHIIYRGEDQVPEITSLKIKEWDSSNVSESQYPFVDATLANGGRASIKIRISDHDQVSQFAPRYYDIDIRTTRKKGERKASFEKRVLEEARPQIEEKIAEIWEQQAAIIHDLTRIQGKALSRDELGQESSGRNVRALREEQAGAREDEMRGVRGGDSRALEGVGQSASEESTGQSQQVFQNRGREEISRARQRGEESPSSQASRYNQGGPGFDGQGSPSDRAGGAEDYGGNRSTTRSGSGRYSPSAFESSGEVNPESASGREAEEFAEAAERLKSEGKWQISENYYDDYLEDFRTATVYGREADELIQKADERLAKMNPADVGLWYAMWENGVRSQVARQFKQMLQREVLRLADERGWNYGERFDPNGPPNFKSVLYIDTPFGQVSFHQRTAARGVSFDRGTQIPLKSIPAAAAIIDEFSALKQKYRRFYKGASLRAWSQDRTKAQELREQEGQQYYAERAHLHKKAEKVVEAVNAEYGSAIRVNDLELAASNDGYEITVPSRLYKGAWSGNPGESGRVLVRLFEREKRENENTASVSQGGESNRMFDGSPEGAQPMPEAGWSLARGQDQQSNLGENVNPESVSGRVAERKSS